jgi:hypothetical protein|tara:strand:+ start:504 stop:791 length:288 start_codon:yes stop_codon:yes gene_type:complete
MRLTKQRLKEIISEELAEARYESLNPEWDKVSEIKSALVYLADDLENSERDDVIPLANAIVKDLHGAVRAMERRLNEKFGAVEPKDDLAQGDLEL